MSEIPFNSRAVQTTTGIIGLVVVVMAIYSISSGNPLYKYFVYIIFPVITIGMKFAAPRIPWLEVAICTVTILSINLIIGYMFANHSPLYFLLGEVLIPTVCVFGFGVRWVYKSYLPASANYW